MLLDKFFPIVDTCLSCDNAMVPLGDFWRLFLGTVFSASRVQHISDLHSKFALRSHHVCKYGRHPMCGRWDWARKNIENRKKPQDENIMVCPIS